MVTVDALSAASHLKASVKETECFVVHTSGLAVQTVSSVLFCFTTTNLDVMWHDALQTNFFLERSKADLRRH
jgi:hypothetical protein